MLCAVDFDGVIEATRCKRKAAWLLRHSTTLEDNRWRTALDIELTNIEPPSACIATLRSLAHEYQFVVVSRRKPGAEEETMKQWLTKWELPIQSIVATGGSKYPWYLKNQPRVVIDDTLTELIDAQRARTQLPIHYSGPMNSPFITAANWTEVHRILSEQYRQK